MASTPGPGTGILFKNQTRQEHNSQTKTCAQLLYITSYLLPGICFRAGTAYAQVSKHTTSSHPAAYSIMVNSDRSTGAFAWLLDQLENIFLCRHFPSLGSRVNTPS